MGKVSKAKKVSTTGTSSKSVKKSVTSAISKIIDEADVDSDCKTKIIKAIGQRLEVDSMSCYPVGVRVTELPRPTVVRPAVEKVEIIQFNVMLTNIEVGFPEWKFGRPYAYSIFEVPSNSPMFKLFNPGTKTGSFPTLMGLRKKDIPLTEEIREEFKNTPEKFITIYSGPMRG